MHKELIITTTPQETKLAILENDELVEFMIERQRSEAVVGNIYKGRVTKVLPGMQSAFVNIGLERDAFLYVSDFFEDAEEYDKIVSTAEDEVVASLQEGGVTSMQAPLHRPLPQRRCPHPLLSRLHLPAWPTWRQNGTRQPERCSSPSPAHRPRAELLEGEVRSPCIRDVSAEGLRANSRRREHRDRRTT